MRGEVKQFPLSLDFRPSTLVSQFVMMQTIADEMEKSRGDEVSWPYRSGRDRLAMTQQTDMAFQPLDPCQGAVGFPATTIWKTGMERINKMAMTRKAV